MKLSKDLRKVVTYLTGVLGEEPDWQHKFWMDAEMALLNFYPGPVISVTNQILSTAFGADRLYDRGWPYLAKPIYSILSTQTGTARGSFPRTDLDVVAYATIQRMLETDFSWEESCTLFLELPSVIVNTDRLAYALSVCRERNARSIPYLYGVLAKEQQKKESKRNEILQERSKNQVWMPSSSYSGPGDDAITGRWDHMQADIDFLKQEHAP